MHFKHGSVWQLCSSTQTEQAIASRIEPLRAAQEEHNGETDPRLASLDAAVLSARRSISRRCSGRLAHTNTGKRSAGSTAGGANAENETGSFAMGAALTREQPGHATRERERDVKERER